jgi:hypothetical protein
MINAQVMQLSGSLFCQLAPVIEKKDALTPVCGIIHDCRRNDRLAGAGWRYEQNSSNAISDGAADLR